MHACVIRKFIIIATDTTNPNTESESDRINNQNVTLISSSSVFQLPSIEDMIEVS